MAGDKVGGYRGGGRAEEVRPPAPVPSGSVSSDASVAQDDLAAILRELGLGDHARPISPHQAVQTLVLPTIRRLRQTRGCPVSVVRDKDGQPVPGPQVWAGDRWVQTVQVTMDPGERERS